jgi:Ca2+-binding EF-hand superfamily protein
VVECPGSCNGDEQVTVAELVRGVSITLGQLPLTECTAADANHDGRVSVNELVRAVSALLTGCGGASGASRS